MKQLLQQYAAYNVWANSKIMEAAGLLGADDLEREIMSSFSSITKTATHMMEVENVWWERLQLVEKATPPGWFNGSFSELSDKLISLSRQWQSWVEKADEARIDHVFAWYNFKKEYFKEPVYKMLLHLFNHQTHHRGQIVTMLRQLGVDKIPSTDFIVFARGKVK